MDRVRKLTGRAAPHQRLYRKGHHRGHPGQRNLPASGLKGTHNRFPGFLKRADRLLRRLRPWHPCGRDPGRKRKTLPRPLPGHRSGLPPAAGKSSEPPRKRQPSGYPPGHRFVIATREQYHTRILNISVGTLEEGKDDEELIQAVETAWDAGLVVVAAAGNLGPGKESITSPGSSRKIITVGASDDERKEEFFKRSRIQPGYSGRRPTLRLYCKAGAYGSRHRDRLLQRPLRFHPPGLHSKKRHLHGHAWVSWSRRSASLSASGSFQSRCQNAHVRKRCRSETSWKPSGLGFSPDRPVTSLIFIFSFYECGFRNRHILISDVFFRLRLRFFSWASR